MRGLDPRIHLLRKNLSKRWIAGSSPAMTVLLGAVPALRSGMSAMLCIAKMPHRAWETRYLVGTGFSPR
jgi:hypothetical protein